MVPDRIPESAVKGCGPNRKIECVYTGEKAGKPPKSWEMPGFARFIPYNRKGIAIPSAVP
jgi:hypothetical protein